LSTLGSASGHPADDFYDWEPGAGLDLWAGASPDVDAHFAANEVGPTRETSVRVAFNKWGSVSGAPFSFSFGADRTNYSAWDRIDCSPDSTNTIHWDTSIPNSTGFDSFSTVCLTGDNITEFQTVFDDNSGVTWHNDDSNPPAGTLDLRSLAAHEAGHVTGGWLGESVFGHFNDNSGECPNNSNRETMCATTIFGTDWARTLSNHDEHTFANAY
jgi:hypothetical protein